MNDSLRDVFTEASKISNLLLLKIDVCDRRNENNHVDILYDYNIVLLAGGHIPTQNQVSAELI